MHRLRYVDRGRHVRPADRQPVPFIDDDHVDQRVVDLHLLQHRGDLRRRPAGGPPRPRCVRPFPRRCLLDRIQPRDAPRSVPRDGTRHPRLRQARASSRCTAATDRFCRARYRVRSRSRITASTSSGRCPRPRPPLDCRGAGPRRHPRLPASGAAAGTPAVATRSAAPRPRRPPPTPPRPAAASCPITSARRTARLHTFSGTASNPRSAPSPGHRPSNLTVVHRSMGQIDASADDSGSAGNPKPPAYEHGSPRHPRK